MTKRQNHLEIESIDEDNKKKKKGVFRTYLANKTFSPNSFFKVTWDLMIGLIYVTCYIIDPLVVAFKCEPIYDT